MNAFGTLRSAWESWWSPRFSDGVGKPLWADLVVTFLFNTCIALVMTGFAWVFSGGRVSVLAQLRTNFFFAQCIGFSIYGLFCLSGWLIGARRIDSWSGARRAIFFSVVPLLGVFIGYAAGFALTGRLSLKWASLNFIVGALMIWAVLTVVWWRFYVHKVRLMEVEKQLAADSARAAELERRAIDAQLRALQAQIEPHFLFNTLANVVSLVDSQPAHAKRMLERLIDLLRGALSASRAQHATLGQELDLCRAYLDILTIRMAGRLRYEIEADRSLRALPLPPMLLQPLVENAIKHGLEPKVEGGRVRLTASRTGADAIEIVVEDDGAGFGSLTRGGGMGLSNLRERLAALFEGRARLTIEDANPGARVRLHLPAPDAVAAAAASSPTSAEPA